MEGRRITLSKDSPRYRPDIDGLRALAVLPVLMFHFGASWMPGGFTGVDIFFVISGFVIATSIQADITSGVFTIQQFYFKRIKRILPALAVTLIVTAIAATLILLPDDLVDFGKSLAATSGFVSNFYFWKTSGYFAASAQTKPLLHTWSLAVEEQYYLLAPMAFAAIARWGGRRWLLLLGPFAVVSLACSIAAVFLGPTAGFFLLPPRLWELLLGALLALAGGPLKGPRWVAEALSVLGLALIAYGLFYLQQGEAFPGWNACFPCFGAALLIQSGWRQPGAPATLINSVLASAPLVWIGGISYSLYLVHWPIAAFHKYLALGDARPIDIIWMMGLSIALAWLSWRFVERPFRKIDRTHLRGVLAGQAVALAVGVAVGVGLVSAHGLPKRFPNFGTHAIAGVKDWGGGRCFNQNATHATPWSAEACTRIHGPNGRILVWGDSFAAQYMPGILRDQARINADVMQYTFAGCPPILAYKSFARVACAPFNHHALDIIDKYQVDTVVLAGLWQDVPAGTLNKLHETVEALKRKGVQVFVIGQSPMFIMDVQHIDYISGGWRQREGAVSWPVAFKPSLNEAVKAQAKDGVFIDPTPFLCEGGRCAYRDGSTFYVADYGHFSTDGALRAVRAYFPSGDPSRKAQPVQGKAP